MIIDIDVDPTVARNRQLVQLEGREYVFEFDWIERQAVWYLSISDQNETPLASAVGLLLGEVAGLLRRFKDSRLPPGALIMADNSGANTDIQIQDELGARVSLLYITSDDEIFTGASG